MTLGSGGETSLGEHHRATTSALSPISHPPSFAWLYMICQHSDWWSSHPQFRLFTSNCVYKRKWLFGVNVCTALMCILGRRPRARERLHDNERSVNIGQLSIWVQHSLVLISKPQSPISPNSNTTPRLWYFPFNQTSIIVRFIFLPY